MISIPGYTISGKLHESGETLIFRGLRTADKKRVVLKCINPANRRRIEIAEFEREYEITRRFDDPRIVPCLGMERPCSCSAAMIFEDIQGVSLDRIDGFERNDIVPILKTALDIAAAIGRIHSHGIIHNDINPSNIILNPRTGRVNIIDFGLASQVTGETPSPTNKAATRRTLPYIAPEQTRLINGVTDYRTDLYAFGITLYEMLTGALPFSGEDSLEVMHGHIAGTPLPPHEIRPGLPAAVSQIVEKLMAKTPDDRYQDIGGLIPDISCCIAGLEKNGRIELFSPGCQGSSAKRLAPQDSRGRMSEASATDGGIDPVTRKIRNLPADVGRLLMLAACMGNRFNVRRLSVISSMDTKKTATLLRHAIAAKLIEAVNGCDEAPFNDKELNRPDTSRFLDAKFKFTHDRVREAAYRMFSAPDKQQAHLGMGILMLAGTPGDKLGENLFDIVNHFNMAGSKIHDPNEKLLLSRLNLEAGRRAMRPTDHGRALVYFSNALELLPEKSWADHYELTCSVTMQLAQCEFLSGMTSLPESRLNHMLEKVRTCRERIDIYRVIIRIRQAQGEYEHAVKTGLTALDLLNTTLPLSPGSQRIFFKNLAIRLKLRGKRPEDLFRLRRMENPRILAVMDILGEIIGAAMIYNRNCAAYISLEMLALTLKYGHSDHSPVVYVAFGAIMAGKYRDYINSGAYGRLALTMAEHSENKDIACKTHYLFAENINPWVNHAKTSLKHYARAQRDGMASGNPVMQAWAAACLMITPIITGRKLSAVNAAIKKQARFIRRIHYDDMERMLTLADRYVSVLKHDSPDLSELSGDGFNEGPFIRDMKKNCRHSGVFAFYDMIKTQLFFLARQYEKAVETADCFDPCTAETKGGIFLPEYYFYLALSMARIYPAASARRKRSLLRRMKTIENQFKRWAKCCQENFSHKYMLVRAEISRIKGNTETPPGFYNRSIQAAISSGYRQNEAIANECAAFFYLGIGNRNMANTHLANAHFAYRQWGAAAKALQIETDFPFLSTLTAPKDMATLRDRRATDRYSHHFHDWRSLLKTFHVISREIDLPALIQAMMKHIIENAGAQRGVLLLKRQDGLYVEAESRIEWKHVLFTHSIPLSDYAAVPKTIIDYAIRKSRPVILADARAGHLFTGDAYFNARTQKSVLCSPIVYQGRLKGIIYLENNAAPSIFTDDRVFAIDMLSAQAAISLENAILYNRLKASENKYRSIFENAAEGLFQLNRKGAFIRLNQSLSDILGYENPGEPVDSEARAVDLFFFDAKQKILFTRQLNRTGRVRDFDGHGKRQNGDIFWISVSVRTIYDPRGKVASYEGSVVDITERKQKEKAERQKNAAEATARAKTIFLANMGHEVRTPLNAILALSELALMDGPGERQKDLFTKINHCASTLLKTINHILDFSKFEAGRVTLENIDFTISRLFKKINDLFAHRTLEKDIVLASAISEDIPPVLTGDPFRLGQILTNLVENAFKFTTCGKITLGATCLSRCNKTVRLRFFVSDTGPGITEADMPRLFSLFSQADSSIARRYGGSGLGLAISKGIVTLMNGRIWAENNPDRGATFYFEIDIRYRNRAGDHLEGSKEQHTKRLHGPDEKREPGAPGMHLLLVDDHSANREIARNLLKRAGYIVDSASNADEAIEKVSRKQYDAVLMDVQMPGMDGFETARTIRADPMNRNLVIIALTAHAMDDCREQFINAGMNSYLSKPIDMDRLNSALAAVVDNSSGKVRNAYM